MLYVSKSLITNILNNKYTIILLLYCIYNKICIPLQLKFKFRTNLRFNQYSIIIKT